MNLEQLYEFWRSLKNAVRFGGEISADAMHVNLGILGFFIFLWLFRRTKWAAVFALIAVFVFQFANELTDIFFDFQQLGNVSRWNTIEDFMLTLFWPCVFTVFILYRKRQSKL